MIGLPVEFLPDNGIICLQGFFHINGFYLIAFYGVGLNNNVYFTDFKTGLGSGIAEGNRGYALVGKTAFGIEFFYRRIADIRLTEISGQPVKFGIGQHSLAYYFAIDTN